MNFKKIAMSSLVATTYATVAAPKPNIVFLLVDDQGWTDLSGVNEYSSKFYKTPAIEKLVKKSVVFGRAYSEPVCAPTRANILTGNYPVRHHMYTVTNPKDNPKKHQLGRRQNNKTLPKEFTTIANQLKKGGYTCAQIGKWHLGKAGTELGPKSRGFDITYGGSNQGMPGGGKSNATGPLGDKGGKYWAGNDGKFHYLANLPANGKSGQYLTDRLTEETVNVMDQVKENPFFIYLAHYGIHAPLQAPKEDQAEYKNKPADPAHPNHKKPVFAGMIASIDRSVDKIVTYLENTDDPRNSGHKLIENTMFIYMSDNGGVTGYTDNAPLRQGKATPYEGGVRVPLIIRWKNKTGRSDTPVHTVDFYETISELAGVKHKTKTDGVSILPLLDNKQIAERSLFRHQPVHVSGAPSSTITSGDYKLTYHYKTPDSKKYKGYGWYEFYNLKKDIGESNNLAKDVNMLKKKPASAIKSKETRKKFTQLARELNKWLKDTKAPLPYIIGTKTEVELPKI